MNLASTSSPTRRARNAREADRLLAEGKDADDRERVRAEPESFETVWRVALLRIAKDA